ncbi:transglutaminase domain-containing protein [Neobacillus sp. SCS-31]|uniref:transglutaminase domain-containing protein n=1 Tax=Neobacillus oceani TaxID=3115292 RepID=UPI003906368A
MKKFVLIVFFGFLAIIVAQPGLPFAMATSLSKDLAYEASSLRTKDHGLLTTLSFHVTRTMEGNPFLLPSGVVESGNSEIIRIAEEVTYGKKTAKEKSIAIYKWVTENLEYDAATYFDAIAGRPFEFKSALEALNSGKAMCMGFSHLNAAIHRAAGIEAKVVFGSDHAWNEIMIDGKWVPQDTTRGAGYIDNRAREFIHKPNLDYLFHTDEFREGEYLW